MPESSPLLLCFVAALSAPVTARACELTATYVRGHSTHFRQDALAARTLLTELAAFESECHEIEGQIAIHDASKAQGRSCEGLQEVSKLYDRIDSASSKCKEAALTLNRKIDAFYQNTMDPDAQRDRGLYEALSGDEYLRSHCGAEVKASLELFRDAASASAEVNSAVERTVDDRKKFAALADSSHVLKETSEKAFINCAGMGSPVSAASTGGAVPKPVRAPARAGRSGSSGSSITGVDDDAAKRAKPP